MRVSILAFTLACGVAAAASSAAVAADLGARYPTKAGPAPVPYIQPLYNWTGFYLGANIGYGWSSGSGTMIAGPFSGPFSGSGNGVLGGIQGGYNWQFNRIVFGVEADIQASGGKGDVNGSAGPVSLAATAKTPYFGTLRGRLGYAFDQWMIYATGGALYGQSKLDGTLSTTGAFSASTNYWTWTVGGGVEYALWDNWTTKLEYLYAGTPNTAPLPPNTGVSGGSGHSHIVRAGVNYRF